MKWASTHYERYLVPIARFKKKIKKLNSMSWPAGTSNSYVISYQKPCCLRRIEVGTGHFWGGVKIHAIVLAR